MFMIVATLKSCSELLVTGKIFYGPGLSIMSTSIIQGSNSNKCMSHVNVFVVRNNIVRIHMNSNHN